MKAIVHRQALVDVLGLACGVVPARSPKPVLTCVRLSTTSTPRGKVLSCVSTDLEATLETTLAQVDIKQDGSALLPANKLNEIVNSSPDETLALEVNGEKATLKGADSTFTLLGYNVNEFPPISGFEGEPDFSISAGQLKSMLDRTRFAAAREMSRYAINGVLFERKAKKLSLVATDGHRLAQARDEVQSAGSKDHSAVAPIRAIGLLDRLLTDPEQTVQLQFRENKLFVRVLATGSNEKDGVCAMFSAALVEGSFPPYQDVIPKDCDRKAVINRDKLLSGVRRAALLTNEESRSVRLSFSPKQLIISARAPEMGDAKLEVPVEFSGEAIEIGFNPNYLAEALKVAPTEDITFELKSPGKPGMIRSGSNFLYVIMPVNLS
ncbi:MAG TPA: DNA polymerase III subunit beta [Phycisphaerae bacterium]|nr:DNA polymerase III subunit beta [Phycisphaerae bacterium]